MRTPEQETKAAIERQREEQDPSFTRFAAGGGNYAAERAEATEAIPAHLLGTQGLDRLTDGLQQNSAIASGFPMELDQFHPALDPKAPREHTAFLVNFTDNDYDPETDEPFELKDSFLVVLPENDIAAAAELAKTLIEPDEKIDSVTALPTAVYLAIPTDA